MGRSRRRLRKGDRPAIGIAQSIAELPLFSGFVYRVVCWVIITAVCTWFVALRPESRSKPQSLSDGHHSPPG